MRGRSLSVLAAFALLTGCGLTTTAAAVVNGRPIEGDRFQRQLEFLLADPRLQPPPVEEPGGEEEAAEQQEQQEQEFARQFLTFLIHQELLREYAEANGIEVSEDDVREQLDQQIETLGGQEQFEQQLSASGAARADVEALIREQVLRTHVAEAVATAAVDEEQLRAEYEGRIAEFTTADISHILVGTEAEARRIAEDATPQNFADLARRFSQDPGSAGRGGDLGQQPLAGLVGPFGEAVLEIPEGSVGGPVQTQFGWHLILVRSRETQPFPAVRDRLVEETRGRAFAEWLEQRIAEAEIRVNPRYGLFDPGSGQVVPRNQTTPSPPPPVQVAP